MCREFRSWLAWQVFILVVGAVFALGVTGCNSEKSKPLVIWVKKTFVPEADRYLVDGFTEIGKKMGIEVEVEVVSSSNLAELYSAAIEGGNLPSIGIIEPYYVDNYHNLGLLQPVDEVVDYTSTQGKIFPAILSLGEYQNRYFSLPVFSAGMVLYYRKDLLAQQGFSAPPSTWPELAQVARAVTRDGVYGLGFTLGLCDDADNQIRSGLWSYGSSLLDEKGNVVVNQAGTRTFFTLLKDLYREGVIPPSSPSWDDVGNNTAYLSEQVAMVMNTPSIYKATEEEGYEDLRANTGLASFPAGPSGLLKTPGDTLYFGIFSEENADKAREILKGFYQMDFYAGFVNQLAPAFIPVYQELRKEPVWQDPNNAAVMVSAATAAFPGYPGKTTQIVGNIYRQRLLSKAVQKMMVEDLPVEQVVRDLEVALKEVVAASAAS